MVQLGGLEPPTSGSTIRSLCLFSVRTSKAYRFRGALVVLLAPGKPLSLSYQCQLAIHPAGTRTGIGMGDLRNKMAKLARDEEHRRYMAEHYPPPLAPKPAKCQCGNTHLEAHLWAWSGDRNIPSGVYCTGCLPPGLLPLVIDQAANLPDR